MLEQLQGVFQRMERSLLLKLSLDSCPVSNELDRFMTELVGLTDKLSLQHTERKASSETAPQVEICLEDGTTAGMAFHGVPAGHEFTSFVLGLYNAAEPGLQLDADVQRRIRSIAAPVELKVLVTLSCSMCPDTVVAAQIIAACNSNVTAHIYDLRHFDQLHRKYNVMSAPCLIVNDVAVSFEKKSVVQILDLIEK